MGYIRIPQAEGKRTPQNSRPGGGHTRDSGICLRVALPEPAKQLLGSYTAALSLETRREFRNQDPHPGHDRGPAAAQRTPH